MNKKPLIKEDSLFTNALLLMGAGVLFPDISIGHKKPLHFYG
jgi:hypothetical protein